MEKWGNPKDFSLWVISIDSYRDFKIFIHSLLNGRKKPLHVNINNTFMKKITVAQSKIICEKSGMVSLKRTFLNFGLMDGGWNLVSASCLAWKGGSSSLVRPRGCALGKDVS